MCLLIFTTLSQPSFIRVKQSFDSPLKNHILESHFRWKVNQLHCFHILCFSKPIRHLFNVTSDFFYNNCFISSCYFLLLLLKTVIKGTQSGMDTQLTVDSQHLRESITKQTSDQYSSSSQPVLGRCKGAVRLFCNTLEKIPKNFIKQRTLGANEMFLKALPHKFLINPWMMMISPNYDAIREIRPWPQDWKRSVFIPIPKKGNCTHLTCQ